MDSNKYTYCFGLGSNGQLGNNQIIDKQVNPTKVNILTKQVICSVLHTCLLSETKQTYCFGNDNYGQLGNGVNMDKVKTPQNITNIDNMDEKWKNQQ